ncbi:hypothetical protein PUNSTDRAFT_55178 [Punctularia strigosozonata HHB-11173 SS5]|uniref:Uncharacterized protein n=1 Tax=Punctularia strigosozonata (strain HHB-11173) TaxID=741275 RepID=R7S5M6_PUNST|nr:uncharacterized protein PUNSTDRAFT_55178 [Punctularia strigosozonata HHB-11173 SS5]EIN05312.1 hypothetical protein PUNSTDRAFT_55178 [Punctularia strigosozonata HHB-11173 SS5]
MASQRNADAQTASDGLQLPMPGFTEFARRFPEIARNAFLERPILRSVPHPSSRY